MSFRRYIYISQSTERVTTHGTKGAEPLKTIWHSSISGLPAPGRSSMDTPTSSGIKNEQPLRKTSKNTIDFTELQYLEQLACFD